MLAEALPDRHTPGIVEEFEFRAEVEARLAGRLLHPPLVEELE